MISRKVLQDIKSLIIRTYEPSDVVDEARLRTIIHVCCMDANIRYEQPYEDLLLKVQPQTAEAIFDAIVEAMRR